MRLSDRRPDLVPMWSPRNEISADQIAATSKDASIWWLCPECGREFQGAPVNRIKARWDCCRNCAASLSKRNMKPPASRTLAEVAPELCGEYSDRNELPASDIFASSLTSVLWDCSDCGRTWATSPHNRRRGRKCPCHAPSLLTEARPDIAAEIVGTTEGATTSTSKCVEWQCAQCGTRWTASPRDRVLGKSRCPECPRIFTYVSDVEWLRQRWSERNEESADDVPAWGHEKYWWKCLYGHEFYGTTHRIGNAMRRGRIDRACPECRANEDRPAREERARELARKKQDTARRIEDRRLAREQKKEQLRTQRRHAAESRWTALIQEQGRDLASSFPEVAEQLVTDVDPAKVSIGSGQSLRWRCAEGHEWEAVVKDRCSKESGCPYCSGRLIVPGSTDLAALFPEVAKDWHPDNPLAASQISGGSNEKVLWLCKKCGHEWRTAPLYRCYLGRRCPHCAAVGNSRHETEIADALREAVPDLAVEMNKRGLIGGRKEIDLFIPSRKMGIEFNGLWWHSENMKDRHYHHEKYRAAKSHGIELIQIWEHEWRDRREQVKSLLLSKLGYLPGIGARSCQLREISRKQALEFFENTHIQGASKMITHAVALFSADGIVAALGLRIDRSRGEMVIERFASSVRVAGGFSRLLRKAEGVALEHGIRRVVTFSDNCISSGALYRGTGFEHEKDIPPDYRYLYQRPGGPVLANKRMFRKEKFRNDPSLEFQESLTERELAKLNGLVRVWDAGKVRWVRTLVV